MRIAIDLRVLSSAAALRGMGRYTQQQLREVLRIDRLNQYFGILYGEPTKGVIFEELRDAPNLTFVPAVADTADLPNISNTSRWNSTAFFKFNSEFERRLHILNIDVFHSATPFIGPSLLPSSDKATVATLYDLIPLIFPSSYFPADMIREDYYGKLEWVRKADEVIAISQSARDDLIAYTGYRAEDIHLCYPIIEKDFSLISGKLAELRLQRLRAQAKLPRKFMLSVTGIHRSKNLPFLLDAYKAYSRQSAAALPLLIVLPDQAAKNFFSSNFGNVKNVYNVCDILDSELAALYNVAEFVVQPSLYEGFGYPVAEAMSCGAAVVTTNSSSLPETVGKAAILVDPTDVGALSTALSRLANNETLCRELKGKSLEQASKFHDGENLGRGTLEVYERAAARRKRRSDSAARVEDRGRIAIWSSMPPLDCGVADYTLELAEGLSAHVDVDFFVDGKYMPSPLVLASGNVKHFEEFEFLHDQNPYAQIVYQLGGRSYQEFIYKAVERFHGIAVFHDLFMGLGFYLIAKSSKNLSWFEENIVSKEGQSVFDAYCRFKSDPPAASLLEIEKIFNEWVLLRWIVESSKGNIVHTPELREELQSHYTNFPVAVVRMGVSDTQKSRRHSLLAAWRLALGVPPDGLIVGSFGTVEPTKRIESALSAFKAVVEQYPSSLFLLVGRFYDQEYKNKLLELTERLDLKSSVLMFSDVELSRLQDLLVLCDIVVNLRYPGRKNISAILLRALAAGKPVIVHDIREWRNIPDEICWRIPPDRDEISALRESLLELGRDPTRRKQMGNAAREWFLENATIDVMTNDYIQAFASFSRA